MKKVLVLEGGYNEEHAVSLNTGREIKKILKKLKIHHKALLVNPNTFSMEINQYSRDFICFNAFFIWKYYLGFNRIFTNNLTNNFENVYIYIYIYI